MSQSLKNTLKTDPHISKKLLPPVLFDYLYVNSIPILMTAKLSRKALLALFPLKAHSIFNF